MTKNRTTEGEGETQGDFESLGQVAIRVAGKLVARAGKRKLGRSAVRASNDNMDTGCASEIERRFPWGE